MYHFNPISDISLFENIETQYLYDEKDVRKEGMYQYIYWYERDYNIFDKKHENEIFKRVELNEDSLPIEDDKCIVPEGVTSIGSYCFKDVYH